VDKQKAIETEDYNKAHEIKEKINELEKQKKRRTSSLQ